MRNILSSGNQDDLRIAGQFLVFLEKAGNDKAHVAVLKVCAREMNLNVKECTGSITRHMKRSMFSQTSSPPGDVVTSILKAISYLSD